MTRSAGGLAVLSQDAAQPRVRVLDVRAGLALEAEDRVPVEVHVLDPLALEVVEDHRADADGGGDALLVRQVRVLRLDRLPRALDRLAQHVLEQDHLAASPGHLLALEADHAEVRVKAILRPGMAHHFEDFEDLPEVELLLAADDIDHLCEMEPVPPVFGGRHVARVVMRGSI